MSDGYLKPKVKDPKFIRDKKNGQFINPPAYMQLGGLSSAEKLNRSEAAGHMSLEKSGPSAQRNKPI